MEAFVGPGQTLAGGKYRVERILGQGGMGVVVSALHVPLGQHVALKFLQPEMAVNPGATNRFLREARAAAQIQSEHVARVMDVGTLDFGAPYMVMELLRGSDLARVLREKGRLSVEQAVSYVLQACEAIAEAHSLGIVHRDVKPANLFLTQRADGSPLVKVLDFGISKAAICDDEFQASMTSTNAVMGSPRYMAPEQLRNAKDVDARADIWSIGIVLYELVAGVPPYPGETPWDLMSAIISDKIPVLREARPDAPALLDRVISRCLEKDRERRYADLAELVQALRDLAPPDARVSIDRTVRIIRGSQVEAGSLVDMPGAEAASPATFTASAWDSHPERPFRRRRLGIGAAAVAAVGLAGAAVYVFRGSSGSEPVTSVQALSSGAVAPDKLLTAQKQAQGSANANSVASASSASAMLNVPATVPRVEPENVSTAASATPEPRPRAASEGGSVAKQSSLAAATPARTPVRPSSAKSTSSPSPVASVKASPPPPAVASKPRPSLTDLMQSRKPSHGKSP